MCVFLCVCVCVLVYLCVCVYLPECVCVVVVIGSLRQQTGGCCLIPAVIIITGSGRGYGVNAEVTLTTLAIYMVNTF